ncbi:class I SAM-dependent methyltransferase [Fertoebacter nigrum]|uniref:Class I SAM-dependent methyltransferase n=1 Tax=Fertoeibacter niger TaxID=2656921 RepID=A0A8X8H0F9_9RHOB|nr:class I SAM-dependent methyltransferase [Fertoeibacter niger]NUB43223.1 class I SAM-dependent methyltransferase [Fertoeibacter niger]
MTAREAFFTIHSGLVREGPGDRDSLDWAVAQAGTGPDARVLDAGCGPGADIASLLAHVPQGHVTALDKHPDFVARVAEAHAADTRVTVREGDMLAPDGLFDLIWSAGAIYNMGITPALIAWRRHLAPEGRVAFSDAAWRHDAPSATARAFWLEYPGMTDRAGIHAQVVAAGYTVIADRWLSDSAWAAYYTPLAARVSALRAAGDPALAEALAETEAELAVWRDHGGDYGYLLVVAEPAA